MTRRPTGDLEAEVLAQLWVSGRALTPGEVLTGMGSDLAYTTIMTIMTRLWHKGLLDRERAGRAFAYRPRVSEAEITAGRMHQALARTRDRKAVLSEFVEALPRGDARVLRSILDDLDGSA